jgi:hypothetical protein
VNDGSGVPKVCGTLALTKPFGARATGLLLKGAVPTRNVIVPVGLVLAGWTVAVKPTLLPTVWLSGGG